MNILNAKQNSSPGGTSRYRSNPFVGRVKRGSAIAFLMSHTISAAMLSANRSAVHGSSPVHDYNHRRPYSAHGGVPRVEFAEKPIWSRPTSA